MSDRRVYGDSCGIARGLDVVGSRWALLVVRELLLGPKRFGDLRTGLPGTSAETLAQRLRELEADGVVARATLPPPTSAKVYELTAWGRELEPVVLAVGRWGSRGPFPPGDQALSPDALVLALPTVFDAARAEGLDEIYALRLGHDRFGVRVRDGRVAVAREEPLEPAATLTGEPAALTAVLWHGAPLDGVEITGSRDAARRFLGLFPAPVPA